MGLLGHVDPALEDSRDLLKACGIVQRGFGLLLSPLVLALALGAWLLLWLSLARRGFMGSPGRSEWLWGGLAAWFLSLALDAWLWLWLSLARRPWALLAFWLLGAFGRFWTLF